MKNIPTYNFVETLIYNFNKILKNIPTYKFVETLIDITLQATMRQQFSSHECITMFKMLLFVVQLFVLVPIILLE
jgi:hypothetical protein